MRYSDYKSPMLSQIRDSVETLNTLSKTMTFEYLANCVPAEAIRNTGMVILTGCKDSYCAAITAKPVFQNAGSAKFSGMIPGTPAEVHRSIRFSRYYNTRIGGNFYSPDNNLVCSISISGEPVRSGEAHAHISTAGGKSIVFSDNIHNDIAKEAQHVVELRIPPCEYASGITTYYTSSFALMIFGLYLSVAKGQLSIEGAEEQRCAILDYVNSYSGEVIERIEVQAFEISSKWRENIGVEIMDFVADGADYSTALFGSSRIVESSGGLTTIDNSEDWCHINFFNRKPHKAGTFVIANSASPSLGRCMETISVMAGLERPLAVISDMDASVFPKSAEVFSLPKPKFKWINPLMQHIPIDFVAAYTGLLF